MPHALLKDFKSNLPLYVGLILARLEAAAITYINTKINEIIQKLLNQCPPEKELKALMSTLDSLKSVMNKFDETTSKLQKIPDTMEPAIMAGEVVVEILSHMAIPSSVPPGVGVPLGAIQTQSNILVFTRKMVETIGEDQKQIRDLLATTANTFNPIKIKIAMIEGLLSRCLEDPDLSQEERDNILNSGGRVARDTDANVRGGEDYLAANGETYSISVIEVKEEGFNIPRHRAIAKDFRGIVVLQGPLSFAGTTQVLIDEIKFRLDRLNKQPVNLTPEKLLNLEDINNLMLNIPEVKIEIPEIKTPSAGDLFEALTVPRRFTVQIGKDVYVPSKEIIKLQLFHRSTWKKIKPYVSKKEKPKGLRKIDYPNVKRV